MKTWKIVLKSDCNRFEVGKNIRKKRMNLEIEVLSDPIESFSV